MMRKERLVDFILVCGPTRLRHDDSGLRPVVQNGRFAVFRVSQAAR
jgi:hypothetical protein